MLNWLLGLSPCAAPKGQRRETGVARQRAGGGLSTRGACWPASLLKQVTLPVHS
jgi:hypothetical protein